jgi:hypothetical protein
MRSHTWVKKGLIAGVFIVAALSTATGEETKISKVEQRVAKLGLEMNQPRRYLDLAARTFAELQAKQSNQTYSDDDLWDEALQVVATKENMSLAHLRADIDAFITALKANPNAGFLDKARMDFAGKRFLASAENAGHMAEVCEDWLKANEKSGALATPELEQVRRGIFQSRKLQGLALGAAKKFADSNIAYQEAIRAVNREAAPREWADLQVLWDKNLPMVLGNTTAANEEEESEEEAKESREAPEFHSREAQPQTYDSFVVYELADTAKERQMQKTQRALLRDAVKECRLALGVYTREAQPLDWARVQYSLAIALRDQAEWTTGVEQVALLGEAVKACRSSLEVRTRDSLPREWATTQNTLAALLSAQAEASMGAERSRLIPEAVAACRLALEAYAQEALSPDWASAQYNLANALRYQAEGSKGSERASLYGEAIKAYRSSMEVDTRSTRPWVWAAIQHDLANSLKEQAVAGDKAEKEKLLRESVKAYRLAMEINTPDTFPEAWARLQTDLAATLRTQAVAGEGVKRAKLFGEAVDAYRLALQHFKREAHPTEWAIVQHNLATTLRAQAKASKGVERASLLGESIEAYRLALEVTTREAQPQEWATLQRNLANALSDETDICEGKERVRYSMEAISACRASMQVVGVTPEMKDLLVELLGSHSYYLLFTKRSKEAIEAAAEALNLAPTERWIRTNQAHGYLLSGQFAQAEAIYTKYAHEVLNDDETFAQVVRHDFAELRKAGIDHPDMARIESLLGIEPKSQANGAKGGSYEAPN